MTGGIAALIVAAGRGHRAGGSVPKQFQSLLGQPVLWRSAWAFAEVPEITAIQIVTAEGLEMETTAALGEIVTLPFVHGGETRQQSVRHGLEALAALMPEFVLIHDAARPLVSAGLIRRVITALEAGATAAIPLLPLADTLKRKEPENWTSISRHGGLYKAQTPQGFR